MKPEEKIEYGLVYQEVIHKIFSEMGLSPNDASHAVRGMRHDELKEKFTGTDQQWEMLCDAAKDAEPFKVAIDRFTSMGIKITFTEE